MNLRVATTEDIALVSEVLSAAAAHLRVNNQELWLPANVSRSAVSSHIEDGFYYLGFNGASAVGVFRLQPQDSIFWPEVSEGSSAYLHKLAVHPAFQGQRIAQTLLRHAVDLTGGRGFDFLRIDCRGGRPKLRAVYESFGFQHHSQILLRGQVFERFEFDVNKVHT